MAVDNLPFTSGGLDAGGRSYSGVLLGASQTVGGTLFSLGPMGFADAVSGQTVTLPAGQFTSVNMLATGLNGNQTSQKFTVTYLDGTTTVFTQNMSDWFAPQGSLLQGSPTFNNVPVQIGAAGQNNAVSCMGNFISLPAGQYSSLAMQATGVTGAQLSQPFKVLYSDGTSATITQSLSDWFTPASYAGEITALSMPYRNAANGIKDNRMFQLYQYTLNLNNSRRLAALHCRRTIM